MDEGSCIASVYQTRTKRSLQPLSYRVPIAHLWRFQFTRVKIENDTALIILSASKVQLFLDDFAVNMEFRLGHRN
ncbi:hypothetical protein CEXT_484041 [Caerostris extrusa]|uniref:Uncharacterized protein n=1 Tax=Caerostris extrusa TaxID=172846 RepID=A0AAV4U5Z1_CAEEX|nr:hypothetical protein CEXT_484041 [Caerostris extrusa]